MKKVISILFTLLLLSPQALLKAYDLVKNGADFKAYQYSFTQKDIEKRICHMLQKDEEITNYYSISDSALYIFANLEDKKNQSPEFTLFLGQNKPPKNSFYLHGGEKYPLKNLRVAIDPGHFGGSYAKIEEKYIEMDPNPKEGIFSSIYFDEGTLSVMTAKKLAEKLKILGAEVFLTKSAPSEHVYPLSYEAWEAKYLKNAVDFMISYQPKAHLKRNELEFWTNQASATEIFRSTYVYLDLEKRAELINEFKPHVTLSCHYNLGGIYDKQGKTPGTNDDYTLFFVPGAFRKGHTKNEAYRQESLKSKRSRYEFVRLLVTQDLDQSIALAQIAQKHCQKSIKLPPGDHCSYHKILCLKAKDGIYHRNLALPRLVHSPFLYPEPFCQDNFEKAKQLFEDPEILTEKMAQVYADSLLEWAQKTFQNPL